VIAALTKELALAKAKILELEARLGKNSQNSSRPPSSDVPGTRPSKKSRRSRKRRKRGAQPGHPGHFPPIPEHVDQTHEHRPKTCSSCQADLADAPPFGMPTIHIVFELPPIKPIIHAHQCQDVKCPNCGKITTASLPEDVPSGQYDPSVQAMTALLRGEMQQSVRQTSHVMTHILHVPMSTGMVSKTEAQVSEALAPAYQEAADFIQKQSLIHADETGWRQEKKRAWLWVAVSGMVSVFLVHVSRGAIAAKALLGAGFQGILCSDRWHSYRWVDSSSRQLCWSHLKRDFKSFLDYPGECRRIGEALLHQKKRMFRLWNRVRDGTLERGDFQRKMQPIRAAILSLLEQGQALPKGSSQAKCKEILKLKDALFTFVDTLGVEPTNNKAERALRFAVLMRKRSFGCDSERGSRFTERFLTVRATLRSQRKDLYEYLKSACHARLKKVPPPSLLPLSADQDEKLAMVA